MSVLPKEFRISVDASVPRESGPGKPSRASRARASRARKTSANDADRLRKYLHGFGIEWAQLAAPGEGTP